jgi:hypothetical protein
MGIKCEVCNDDQEVKPIKFMWKNGVYHLENSEKEGGDLMVKEHLGIDVPKGISDFQVCLDCQDLLTVTPDDLPLYDKLVNDILRQVMESHKNMALEVAEMEAMDTQLDLESKLID